MQFTPFAARQTRRNFLARTAAAGAALALTPAARVFAQNTAPAKPLKWPIVVFSKAFQQLSFEESADLVAEVGWDGLECPIRKGGQVLPERIEEDLPKFVDILKKRGQAIHIATTDVREVTPLNEKVLRTLAKIGIKKYRMAYWRYDLKQPIAAQVAEIKPQLKDLIALNRELGLTAGYQNHSGGTYVGGPLWDLHDIIKDQDPAAIGSFFDIGHATVEGGTSWVVQAKLLEPRFQSVYVKDFTWQKGAKNWGVKWCPLGEGMINRSFFAQLRASAFAGPIAQHFEYDLGDRAEMLKKFKADFSTLKTWLTV